MVKKPKNEKKTLKFHQKKVINSQREAATLCVIKKKLIDLLF